MVSAEAEIKDIEIIEVTVTQDDRLAVLKWFLVTVSYRYRSGKITHEELVEFVFDPTIETEAKIVSITEHGNLEVCQEILSRLEVYEQIFLQIGKIESTKEKIDSSMRQY